MSKLLDQINLDEILEDIRYLLGKDQPHFVVNIIADLHPADIAEIMSHLTDDERRAIFNLLSPEAAHEVLAELEENVKGDVLEGLDTQQIADMVNEMDSDDAADLVSELPADRATEVLEKLEEESSEEIQELLLYPEDTAGGIMAKEYVAVNAQLTQKEAIEEIRKKYHDVEDLYYCFVIDDFGTLLGMVSLRDLILADPDTKIRDLMKQDIITVDSDTDQEEVARLFRKYDLVVAPVVNKQHKLIGRITIDDIVDVIDEEIEEDLGLIAGTGEEEVLEDSVVQISRSRLPWLILSFFGEFVSAFILFHFEATIQQIIASAFFIPMVMAMGGSAGQQSSVIVVRGLATGEIGFWDIGRRLKREFFVSILNGLVLGFVIFIVVAVWIQDYRLGTILSMSLLAVVLNASLFGSIVPLLFKKFNIDPALATGPFVATFNDVVGLTIYFTFITLSFKFLI
ncbi:MAG: magnesium transporter [Calditrichia bacterium]